MDTINEKRLQIHKWIDQADDVDIEELWERAILEDDGGISEEWELELEKRRELYKSGNAETLTPEELKNNLEQIRNRENA